MISPATCITHPIHHHIVRSDSEAYSVVQVGIIRLRSTSNAKGVRTEAQMGMGVGRRCAPKCSDFAYEMLQFGAYFYTRSYRLCDRKDNRWLPFESERMHKLVKMRNEIWQDCSSSKYSPSDFRFYVITSWGRPWRHLTQKSATVWRVNTKRLN